MLKLFKIRPGSKRSLCWHEEKKFSHFGLLILSKLVLVSFTPAKFSWSKCQLIVLAFNTFTRMKPWLSKLWPSLLKLTRTDETWTYCSEKHFLKLDDDDFFFANHFFALFCKIRVSGKEQVSSCWSSRSGGNTDVATSRRRRRRPRNDFPGSVFIFSVIFSESPPPNVLAAQTLGCLVGICDDDKVFVGLINIKQMRVNKLCYLCQTVCDLNYILLKNLEQNWELQFWIKIFPAHP